MIQNVFSNINICPFSKKVIGIIFIIIVSYIFSKDRKNISWKRSGITLLSIFFFSWLFLNSKTALLFLENTSKLFENLYSESDIGIKFLFGELTNISSAWGFIFAIKVLPIIIFFSALVSILYYLGIIQFVVKIIEKLLRPIYGTNGAETLCAIANSFLGQTEAPLLIKSFLKNMNESEIFLVMVSGMGSLSASLLAVYSYIGIPLKHLLISNILSIPATIFISKLWHPNKSKNNTKIEKLDSSSEKSIFSAMANGTSNGMILAFNVGAMLIVTISLLYCLDLILANIAKIINFFLNNKVNINLSMESIFSFIMWPAAWALGIDSSEISTVANLIGTKVAVNEMIAYNKMTFINLSITTKILATYALCGFSNFSCIGIQLGGIGALEESTKPIIAKLGIRAVFAATLSNLLVAYIIGFFI
jgi:CNT family concentrative nucleoside transporter